MKQIKLLFFFLFIIIACNKKEITDENTELPGMVSFDYKFGGESLKHVIIKNNKDFNKSSVRGHSNGYNVSIDASDQSMRISIGYTIDGNSKGLSLLFNGKSYNSSNILQNVFIDRVTPPFNGYFSGSFDGIQISNGIIEDVSY